MTLTFKHFDTRLNQWLEVDGKAIEEKLDRTLLEFFLTQGQFSFGQYDDFTQAEDLKQHPQGDRLLLASQSRLLYGSPECQKTIEKLCPDLKDRAAYGSIFMGECNSAIAERLNVLVVDDATGENGNVLDRESAWRLTGDCYGQVATDIYDQLSGREENEPYRIVQHRFGWREEEEGQQDKCYRFGKGTLRPYSMEKLEYENPSYRPSIDLILPLSSFKGTDKDNPAGSTKLQIEPGLYSQQMWLGAKAQSQLGKMAISQLLPSFPEGMKDFIELLEFKAQQLAQIQSDPRELAKLYCQRYEERQARIDRTASAKVSQSDEPTVSGQESDSNALVYNILKADIDSGRYQLLEIEKVKRELTRFVQGEWRDIALGKAIAFDRGMIIPSKELKNGEICVPWLEEGEKILNFRSPFLNSNGLCVSTNKHVSDYLAPDGRELSGVIVVSDEDHKRIGQRLAGERERGIVTGEIDPVETESERQARDYDGDCIGVAPARKYPTLTAEAEAKNTPERAYAPTVKFAKMSFYQADGTQPAFESVALRMVQAKKTVGSINNFVTSCVALESENYTIATYGNFDSQSRHVERVASHYQTLIDPKNISERSPIPTSWKEKMQQIAALSRRALTPTTVGQALAIERSLLKSLVEAGCAQNQIAVDMMKSARNPDLQLIKNYASYLHRDVPYIRDKKLEGIYAQTALSPNGCSPVELAIAQTNKYFSSSQLESRPISQFAFLFNGVDFSEQHKLKVALAQNDYSNKTKQARQLEERLKLEPGPFALVRTRAGAEIEITNLLRYNHPKIWRGKTLNLQLQEIPAERRNRERPHKLLAIAQIDGETVGGQPKYRPLGTVSVASEQKYALSASMSSQDATVAAIEPQIRAETIRQLYKEASLGAVSFYNSLPETERLPTAAASWLAMAQSDLNSNKQQDKNLPVADNTHNPSFVFHTFEREIALAAKTSRIAQLEAFCLPEHKQAISISLDSNSQYPIELKPESIESNGRSQTRAVAYIRDDRGEWQRLGALERDSAHLPLYSQATATIEGARKPSLAARIQSAQTEPREIAIREMSKFSHANTLFDGDRANLTVKNTTVKSGATLVKLGDRTLGEIDEATRSQLQQKNLPLAELSLKLQSVGESGSSSSYVIGELPDGTLLQIQKTNYYDLKTSTFNNRDYRTAAIAEPSSQVRDVVFLNDLPLGVLHYNKDKQAVRELGIKQPDGTIALAATLHGRSNLLRLQIDPDSVRYPQTWTKLRSLDAANKDLSPTTQLAEALTAKLKQRPSTLFASPEDRMLGLIGLAVDATKAPIADEWLRSRSIDFSVPSSELVRQEADRGLVVRYLVARSIDSATASAMEAKFGKPMDGSTYQQWLQGLPPKPQDLVLAFQPRPELTEFANIEHSTKTRTEESSLGSLRQWYAAARYLGKPQEYLDRIAFVATSYQQGRTLPPEVGNAMQEDIARRARLETTARELERLSDRDFLQLRRQVNNYLRHAPSPAPVTEISIVNQEIATLNSEIARLYSAQLPRIERLEELQGNLFGRWGKEYDTVLAQIEQTQAAIERMKTSKERKEGMLQQWECKDKMYHAWQQKPSTRHMQELSEILDLPQMQKRATTIEREALQSDREYQKQFNRSVSR